MNLENALASDPTAASRALPVTPVVASPWSRLAAAILDGIILFPIGILVVFLSSRSLKSAFLLFPIYQLVYVSYQAFFHAKFGATLGKMALKMKVVNEDYSSIDFFTALKRISVEGVLQGALMILSIEILFSMRGHFVVTSMMDFAKAVQVGPYHTVNMLEGVWDYLGFMCCLFSQKRKAIHDFIAGTVVVKQA
jgi:uncharacterized RDD family membrane protein YckC